MHFTVIGHGAREYAIVNRLKREGARTRIILNTRNDALSELADEVSFIDEYRGSQIFSIVSKSKTDCVLRGTAP